MFLLFTFLVLILSYSSIVDGLAYAPNFITKTISQQTGIEPVGLLDITSDDDDATKKGTEEEILAPTINKAVTTRFPPEPNGYLHLGHAKAISFNFQVARMFGGVCNMRLDDTNPSKEDTEYVQSILEDVCWIQSGLYDSSTTTNNNKPWNGSIKKTSDYFDIIYDCAEQLIKNGDAYVDSLSATEMKEYRGTLTEPGKESPYKTSRSKEEHLELFRKMRAGDCKEGEHVLRANIDMSSPNLNLRDPTLYRIKHESHQETGDKWCIYPMYDFSHPIADALEGITHSLCTLEFEDHRPFYDWTLNKLRTILLKEQQLTEEQKKIDDGILPQQIEFSRLNIKSTVLSKRKLIQLVEQKYVNGWDDPRLPTLSGLRRRGVTPSALRLFCERVGISKTDSNIDFTVLEDCIREDMDKSTSRAFAILQPLKVTITNWESEELENFEVNRHPKLSELGNRIIPFGKEIYIERSDFFDLEGPEGKNNNNQIPRGWKRLLPDNKVRLRYAYVIHCDEVIRDPTTQEPIELKCTYLPDTRAGTTPDGMKRIKGIIHWVEATTGISCKVNQYDRLFMKDEPSGGDDYLQDLNPNSLQVLSNVIVEPSVLDDAKIQLSSEEGGYASDLSYQFERSGYFALDKDSTDEHLIFNRVVTLRDTWGVAKKEKNKQQQKQRNRGGGGGGNKGGGGGAGVVDDLRRVAFRAVTIVEAGPHPEADSLLLLKADCGDEDGSLRTIVAGLAGKISTDDLINKQVVAVTNLKPAKMRGIESHAMLLAASDESDSTVELLEITSGEVKNGELLYFEGKEVSEPDAMLKSKGALKVWERVKSKLRSNDNGEATYYEDETTPSRMMTSAGPIRTKSLTNSIIR